MIYYNIIYFYILADEDQLFFNEVLWKQDVVVSATLRRGYNYKNISELVFLFYETKNYRNNIEWL